MISAMKPELFVVASISPENFITVACTVYSGLKISDIPNSFFAQQIFVNNFLNI